MCFHLPVLSNDMQGPFHQALADGFIHVHHLAQKSKSNEEVICHKIVGFLQPSQTRLTLPLDTRHLVLFSSRKKIQHIKSSTRSTHITFHPSAHFNRSENKDPFQYATIYRVETQSWLSWPSWHVKNKFGQVGLKLATKLALVFLKLARKMAKLAAKLAHSFNFLLHLTGFSICP